MIGLRRIIAERMAEFDREKLVTHGWVWLYLRREPTGDSSTRGGKGDDRRCRGQHQQSDESAGGEIRNRMDGVEYFGIEQLNLNLGSGADVVPMLGENRSIMRLGLARLETDPRPGLAALMRRARVERDGVSPDTARAVIRTNTTAIAAVTFNMSIAPRPQTNPSAISAPNGSRDQPSSVTGTTSVWPIRSRLGASDRRPAMRATRLARPGVGSYTSRSRAEAPAGPRSPLNARIRMGMTARISYRGCTEDRMSE